MGGEENGWGTKTVLGREMGWGGEGDWFGDRDGLGTEMGVVRLGNGDQVGEVYTGDGFGEEDEFRDGLEDGGGLGEEYRLREGDG